MVSNQSAVISYSIQKKTYQKNIDSEKLFGGVFGSAPLPPKEI